MHAWVPPVIQQWRACMMELEVLLALRILRCPAQCVYVYCHTSPSCQLAAADAGSSREGMMSMDVGFASEGTRLLCWSYDHGCV